MVRFLGLTLGYAEEPREIASRSNLTSESGENGWLIRFFDSAFFCEWIAVSYLYKHDHAGVRDYLCNRMYTLPLQGVESYLFQICYMMIHKPSPSLDKYVIDVCSKSLKIALKVHWFLMAELEDSDDNEGIRSIQEKCQFAATLMGEWPPLIRPQTEPPSPGGKSQVLNRLLSSKNRLLSLTSSPPSQKSLSFSPFSGNNLQEDGNPVSPDENRIFKKLMPGQKVRDALLFRKSVDKDDEASEKDGFFKRLLRDSKDDEDSEKDNFFKRFLRDSRGDDEDSEKDGFFRRLLRDSRSEDEDVASSSEGLFKRLFHTNDKIEEATTNGEEEESSEFSLFKRLFRVHPEDAKSSLANENSNSGGLFESSPGTENFFRKLFRDRDRSIEDSELLGPKRLKESLSVYSFPIYPIPLTGLAIQLHPLPPHHFVSALSYFSSHRLSTAWAWTIDPIIAHSDPKHPGSPKQQSEKLSTKPPLPISPSQFRKGAYHDSLEFVQSLCDTSYGLVDVFPIEDRKSALREALVEINLHVAEVQNTGGVCFPLGKGMYRVLNIPEDEAVLLNSREKAPYLICVEVLRCEMPSNSKEASSSQKLSQGGIPLANGDALLQKPPPWAYPLQTAQEVYRNSNDRMSSSTAHAIDQAMTHVSEAKIKFVRVNLSLETQLNGQPEKIEVADLHSGSQRSASIHREGMYEPAAAGCGSDLEWVRVVLTADPGVRLEDIEDQAPPRRKEHRRVPSTVAIEEVKAAAAKGEAPLGLPLKGAGQDSSDAQPRANGITPKASDALSGELWEAKKDRICKASIYGKLPGWDLRSVIVKSGDDCRQEHLAVQLISHFYDIFQEAGLPLWLRPYEVLCTSSYTALIETIPDTASIHSIKSRYPNISSLREFFNAKYQENSPSFKLAQRNFVESMAGYSLVCYFLQVKDRHNGNLLLDEEGHIIHIDFGFMLSNSPGGVNFESAPFKLTRELLEVMDSDAEGVPSEFFDYFKVLCIQGFLTCRKHAERIILLVEMLQDSGFPCFKGGARTIQNLRKRFHLSLTEEQCVSLVLSLISSSLDAWRTRQYDYYQKVLNGIL
uniref:1-phosphatidylinositol 4-kinase n=1 Tax=Cajanus cajan TaxID=3821 RepID=A0A151TLF0_CAJCA|nr:Phosphatidylinositol 4-kinase [Cajanus cajan]